MKISATLSTLTVAAIVASGVLASPRAAHAQLRAMAMPINTTLVITKPAPGQIFGNKRVVTLGVGTKQFKFVLNDGYVDSLNPNTQWPDVWQYVKFHQPNFIVQGKNADTFEKIEPGEQVTIKGMFAPLNRTLEVIYVLPGKGPFNPQKHY